jgi:hypothetical protein
MKSPFCQFGPSQVSYLLNPANRLQQEMDNLWQDKCYIHPKKVVRLSKNTLNTVFQITSTHH